MPITQSRLKPASMAAASILSMALLLSACSNDEPEQTGSNSNSMAPASVEDRWLSHISASTPYFFASRERLSEADAMGLIEKLGSMEDMDLQLAELEALKETSNDPAVAQFLDIMVSLLKSFEEVKTLEDYHQRGMMPNARSAFYGVGLLPAIRMELYDEERFKTFFETILANLDVNIQSAELGGTHYWHTSAHAALQTFITIKDEQVILGLLPSTVEQSVIEQLFGITSPTISLSESGELQQLEQRYQYSAYGVGRFSTQKIVDELVAPMHPASKALLKLGGSEPFILEHCRDDIDRLTELFPALVMGVHALDTQRISGSVRFATSSTLAEDFISFTTSVPGLGSGNGIASLGLALDIPAFTRALQKYAGEVRARPFTCPELEGINDAWSNLGLLTNNPMTMLVGPALSGVNVRIDSINMDTTQPSGTGILAFSSPNAQGLLSAVSMFVPQIASLNLQTNGEVKQVDASLLPADLPQVHAAMSSSAILLGVGLEQPSELTTELQHTAKQSNLLSYGHLSSDTFATLAEISTQLPNTDGMDTAELLYMAEVYEKVAFWLGIDESGIELGIDVELK